MIYYLVNAGLSGYIHIVLGVGDSVGVHEITASLVPLPNACGPAFRHSAHAILSLNCVIVVVQKRMLANSFEGVVINVLEYNFIIYYYVA